MPDSDFAQTLFSGARLRELAAAASPTALEVPVALSPDSPVWLRPDDAGVVRGLAEEFLALQQEGDRAVYAALARLVDDMHDLGVESTTDQAPPQVLGRLVQPDGTPAARVQVSLAAPGLSTDQARTATAVTGADGGFVLRVPGPVRSVSGTGADLVVTGGGGAVTLADALDGVQPSGLLPAVTLPQPVTPLPLSVVEALQRLVAEAPSATIDPDDHATPALAVGEDDCEIVFRKDSSVDRFPYGVMFRLTDPALSQPSLVFDLAHRDDRRDDGFASRLGYYGASTPLAALLGPDERLPMHLAQRVSLDRPLSVDGFRDGLARPGLLGGVPVAGSLAIGYVVRMAQQWTPLGLALGDLVYSLPLAPGEQQRIAVVERTATSTVIDAETLDTSEALSFSEADDTSATATFGSAFRETAAGGSAYDTHSDSFSVAAAAGGGGVFPFGCMAGGVATSYGSANSSGSTSTWMSGARDYTSDAAQRTHSSVQRQAAARRRSSRTAMRLATATETDSVVTKVIANHNKTRALTMQYWEVQRMFEVSTAVEGVNLVCMVPLDIVRFLPSGQPLDLDAGDVTTRGDVMARYDRLLRHAETIGRVVPARYQRGLSLITDFAADPTATVASSAAPAEDVLHVSLDATVLPFDELFVTVVGRRGARLGPTRLTGVTADVATGMSTEADLLAELRRRRTGTPQSWVADLVLPSWLPRQEVMGFEISRRTQRLDYHFAPALAADLHSVQSLLGGGVLGIIEGLAEQAASHPSVTRSYTADQLEQEVGGPRASRLSVSIPASSSGGVIVPALTFVSAVWGAVELPRSVYPVSSRTIPPLLSYASVLEIEKTLQWTVRHTMTCSVAVFASLTPEERAVMLERYQIPLPPADDGTPQAVPLLSCVTNNVLGYYGNSMVLPFVIPVEITQKTGLTTAQIQDALTRFHVDGFDPPRSTVALPTKGVLGEAVLGHCPSAEKIDLTRFWNWQDSPGDEATAISPVTVPSGSLTAGLTAPSALPGISPIITNFSTSPVAADTSLAAALTTLAGQQKDLDVAALTNAAGLTTLGGKTLDTAESARKDALGSATQLAVKAMETAAAIYTGKSGDADPKDPKDGKKTDKTGSGNGTGGTGGTATGGTGTGATPVARPTAFSVFFEHDSHDLSDAARPGQVAALDAFIAAVAAAVPRSMTVRGYASPEGTPDHNATLAEQRAIAVIGHLGARGLPGVATREQGGVLAGAPGEYPRLRRADIAVTY